MGKFEFEFTDKKLRGDADEQLFAKCILAENPNAVIRWATTYEDNSRKHIDLWVDDKPIDVKGRKSVGILNLEADAYTILEWLDAEGRLGWLHGEAEDIAFKRRNNFIISPRLKLLEYYKANVKDEWVSDLNQAHLKKYQRFNSKEEMTAVHFNDIIAFSRVLNIPEDDRD